MMVEEKYTSGNERLMREAKKNRQVALNNLAERIKTYSAEIEEEKKKPTPDMGYIQRRVNKIAEMRGTLLRAQRVH